MKTGTVAAVTWYSIECVDQKYNRCVLRNAICPRLIKKGSSSSIVPTVPAFVQFGSLTLIEKI